MTFRSPLVEAALAYRDQLRLEFQDHLEARQQQAERDCNGVLLNARGRAAGVDTSTLFYGPRVRVDAYASEELRDWFGRHGRVTFEEFERQAAADIFPA